jgi:hypothetical protein
MASGLLTDRYELHMAASYLRHGMTAPATFSLFVRGLPPGRGFLVSAGLGDALPFLAGSASPTTRPPSCAYTLASTPRPPTGSRRCDSPAMCGPSPKGPSPSPTSRSSR